MITATAKRCIFEQNHQTTKQTQFSILNNEWNRKQFMKFKRFLALLLALSMVMSFAACGGEKVPTDIPNGDFEAEHALGK